jgi:signal transduction histidine kinase/CheY-like chemotaxis protein
MLLDGMNESWNILVVDDEPDVHQITKLALKHKTWRKRKFALTSANSATEARKVLQAQPPSYFHVALIDVVMETDSAGLELCRYVRASHPSSLRIILRTGQPGVAPEETVLNDYDIDFYLSKSEATPDKLQTVIRSCLRSSQDISTLFAFGRQLQSFTRALQSVSSLEDLLVFMREGLGFLELKHSASTAFFFDIRQMSDASLRGGREVQSDLKKVFGAVHSIHEAKRPLDRAYAGPELQLPVNSFIIPFEARTEGSDSNAEATIGPGGLYVELNPEVFSDKTTLDFCADANLFIENWKIAYSTLRLQERLARERMLREQMYFERLQSIATMVAGVAHEMNTPLGVANTANTMITSLAERLVAPDTPPEMKKEVVVDLNDSCELLGKNLYRAQSLVKSFKQLSGSQLADVRTECNLVEVIADCVRTMSPQLRKQNVEVLVRAEPAPELEWDGYPGHLSQVIMNLVQNVLRYAYPGDKGGKVDIRVERESTSPERLRIEFQDYGAGVAPEIKPRMFEPFVTSGRKHGGTGLGLAITHNIVTNLLGGTIEVVSEVGKGALFSIRLPLSAPEQKQAAQGAN